MKNVTLILLAGLFTLPAVAQNKFVGVKSCICHKLPKQGNQMAIWEKSKHADAFNVLKSDKAAEFMKAKDLKGSATEAKECLECHTTGYGQPQEKSFDMTLGVQCEACHGAASGYKLIHNKPENREKAIAAGFDPKPDEKTCKQCHQSKMHDVPAFDFKKMFDQIKHPMPKG